MAEAIGIASGCLALIGFALESSQALYETIQSFRSHSQRVKDLSDELYALTEVLNSLATMAKNVSNVDFSGLELPLRRCQNACKDFQKELEKCSSHSKGGRTSFRDWAKLRYMGEDIDGFKHMLSSYKITISVALMHANLARTSASAEDIKAFNDLLVAAKTDLEDQLERMNEKLELIGESVVESKAHAHEVKLIKEERRSTEKCLQICDRLSEQITQLQVTPPLPSLPGNADVTPSPEQITDAGLRQCKETLARIRRRLEQNEKELFTRLLNRTKSSASSDEDLRDLAILHDQWEATFQSVEVCSQAHDCLKDRASTIDNYATGDAIQFMVSTNENIIHGKNRGVGWRTRQVGGHIDPESLQQMVRSLEVMHNSSHQSQQDNSEQAVPNDSGQSKAGSQQPESFQGRHGRGFNLKV